MPKLAAAPPIASGVSESKNKPGMMKGLLMVRMAEGGVKHSLFLKQSLVASVILKKELRKAIDAEANPCYTRASSLI